MLEGIRPTCEVQAVNRLLATQLRRCCSAAVRPLHALGGCLFRPQARQEMGTVCADLEYELDR